ncbi:MAG TPA: glycosyltransferase family 39 protein [Verrucomicrobiae bacterium]
MVSRLNISHLILIFTLAALPFAATFALYYPDERHYTDGALGMLKSHDWLVPKTAAGEPRFQKPPMAYWLVAASYATFGTGALTSRLPFLLAGCATLLLVYRMARKLTNNSDTALFAAVVLASHPQFYLCSVRSIPDALLVFFITVSAYGFLRLIVFKEFATGAFCLAYGGAAGAVLSKGLLGAGIVLFAWAFAAAQERDWRAIKKVIHPPIFTAAIILAGSWFIGIFWKDGASAWRGFFGDQVASNLHGHFWSPVWRAPLFALILIFNFLPWSATAIEFLARRKFLAAGAMPPLARSFILAWTAVLILGFALGVNVSLRYLLPATPLFAILIADCLQRAADVRLILSLRRILKITLAALILLDAAAIFIISQWPLPKMLVTAIGVLFLAVMVVLGFGALRQEKITAGMALGMAILLGWLLFFTATMPVLLPDRAQQIAGTLSQAQSDSSKRVLLVGSLQLASRVRALLGTKWTVVQSDKLNLADAKKFSDVLLPEKDTYQFLGHSWRVQTASVSPNVPTRGELWPALKSRRLPELLAQHGQKICLATRE